MNFDEPVLLVTRENEMIPVEGSAAQIADATGNVLGAVIVLRPIVSRRHGEGGGEAEEFCQHPNSANRFSKSRSVFSVTRVPP